MNRNSRNAPIQFTDEFAELLGRADVRRSWVMDTITQPENERCDDGIVHAVRTLPDRRELRVAYQEADGVVVPLSVRWGRDETLVHHGGQRRHDRIGDGHPQRISFGCPERRGAGPSERPRSPARRRCLV